MFIFFNIFIYLNTFIIFAEKNKIIIKNEFIIYPVFLTDVNNESFYEFILRSQKIELPLHHQK